MAGPQRDPSRFAYAKAAWACCCGSVPDPQKATPCSGIALALTARRLRPGQAKVPAGSGLLTSKGLLATSPTGSRDHDGPCGHDAPCVRDGPCDPLRQVLP